MNRDWVTEDRSSVMYTEGDMILDGAESRKLDILSFSISEELTWQLISQKMRK